MTEILFILVIAGLAAVAAALVHLSGRMAPKTDEGSVAILQSQLDALRGQTAQSLDRLTSQVNAQMQAVTQQLQATTGHIGQRLDETTGQIGKRLDAANKMVMEVQQQFGSLSKAAERMTEIGKDIATLQNILQPPKLRGALGELFLENVLSQILQPEYYSLQHSFSSGVKVDAVIRLSTGPQGLVPVDAKFPLTSFKEIQATTGEKDKEARRREFIRDVKKHIDAIASKYILPDEGTFDFALMYIPAENVYYEIIIKDDGDGNLLQYSMDKKVIPVSPNSFYAYLQTILLGLRGMRIEKDAQEILAGLTRLQGDYGKFREEFDTVGKHLSNASKKYEDAERAAEKFSDKLGTVGMISGSSGKKAMPS